MTLYKLRLDPSQQLFADWAARENLLISGADSGYAWHEMLRAAFGELAPKPFRMVEQLACPDYLLGYTTADPSALRDHAAMFADPLVNGALNLPSLALSPIPTTFAAGARLGFEVRVRPVMRQDHDENREPTRERDAFHAAVDGLGQEEKLARERVYVDWLQARLAAGGAKARTTRAASLRRSWVLRPCADGKTVLVEGPDVVLEGTLAVIEPEAFAALLTRGVGRHQALGFGMLLIKPPGRVETSNF
jgi:CRISPR system Cascade subunit CasE